MSTAYRFWTPALHTAATAASITPVEAVHLHDADVAALTPKYVLTPAEAAHLHDAAVASLTHTVPLTPVDAGLVLIADAAVLTSSIIDTGSSNIVYARRQRRLRQRQQRIRREEEIIWYA